MTVQRKMVLTGSVWLTTGTYGEVLQNAINHLALQKARTINFSKRSAPRNVWDQ